MRRVLVSSLGLPLLLACACSAGARGPARNPAAVLVGGPSEEPRPAGREPAPSPGSVPAIGESKNLDEPLAVVEGTVITRRRLARAVGGKESTEDEREFEESLARRLKDRAVELILLKAADREGLRIPPEQLDDAVKRRSEEAVREASKKAGRPVTFEELLALENLSLAEFRERLGNQIVIHYYFESIWKGLPGKRQKLDLDASPADLRRLYSAHRQEFDVPHSAKIAFWVARPVDFLQGGKVPYDAATAAARARLEAILSRVRAGRSPDDVAREMAIPADQWKATRALDRKMFAEFAKQFLAPGVPAEAWLFAPERRARDGQVFDGSRGAILAIAVLETTTPRRRAFEDAEVQDELSTAIKSIRKSRATEQHLLELLSTASVHPPGLAEAIEADARKRLKDIDEHPVKRDVWLR